MMPSMNARLKMEKLDVRELPETYGAWREARTSERRAKVTRSRA